MKSEQIIEVLNKLIGPIEPVADSAIDSDRKKNMELYIEVFKSMHMSIDDIAYRHSESIYHSQKEIGQMAKKQLDEMGIPE